METETIKYDPAVIQEFADQLYAQAGTIVPICTIFGVIVGGAGGFFVGAMGSRMTSVALGPALIGLAGFAVGKRQAFLYRLQAQTALCQKKIEENTRREEAVAYR